jgi:hypothetical protein
MKCNESERERVREREREEKEGEGSGTPESTTPLVVVHSPFSVPSSFSISVQTIYGTIFQPFIMKFNVF